MSLTGIIKEKALELGFAAVGIATAEPFDLYAAELESRREMYEWGRTLGQNTSVKDLDLSRFIDPARSLPGVRSLIVVTDTYYEEDFPPSLLGKVGRCYLKGLFCPEENIHRQRRKELKKFLQGLGIKTIYGPAPARLAGARAGVTHFGRNCFAFANRAVGESSWIVNEPYLVDRELAPDSPTLRLGCPENCRQCLDACPTGALYAPLKMDPRRCIAYLSYFNFGPIPRDLRSRMGTWVYGCDQCQEACPRNKKWMDKTKPCDQKVAGRAPYLQPSALIAMSQEQYEKNIWPLLFYIHKEKRKLWQRNAAIALGNQGDPENVPLLVGALGNPEPLVRAHAAWALGKIGGPKARAALEKALRPESHEDVREEIREALYF